MSQNFKEFIEKYGKCPFQRCITCHKTYSTTNKVCLYDSKCYKCAHILCPECNKNLVSPVDIKKYGVCKECAYNIKPVKKCYNCTNEVLLIDLCKGLCEKCVNDNHTLCLVCKNNKINKDWVCIECLVECDTCEKEVSPLILYMYGSCIECPNIKCIKCKEYKKYSEIKKNVCNECQLLKN